MTRQVGFLVTSIVLLTSVAVAQQADSNREAGMMTDVPLFASHDLLTFTVQAPLKSIMKQRDQESEEFPGTVKVNSPGGETTSLSVKVRTRGKTRLNKQVCKFPPLRLNFQQDSVTGTTFEGQDKLKLVTHCQDDEDEYQQYALLEYLAYRTYNLLTKLSFHVRLARITYVDTEGSRDPVTSYGFLIEDEDMMAARNGWQYLTVPRVPPDMMDPFNVALIHVFQYFIGNTDFSAFMPEPEKQECCHNSKPIGTPAGPAFAVPYDFDMAGLVDTRYANRLYRANLEQLGLRSVRDRLYRGLCVSESQLPAIFDLFNQKRDQVYALYVEQEGLDPKVLENTVKFIDKFYEVVNDERKTKREFHDKCRGDR